MRQDAVRPKLELRGVSKVFGQPGRAELLQVLEGVDLEVAPSEVYCLIGPSGCGKTTLLNIVAGFEQPTSGAVMVDGRPVSRPGPDRGVVFQDHALFPWMSALHNVRFGPLVRGRRDLLERAHHFLQLVGLSGFERHYPSQLSGGMRQRVALARVLANEPDVLLMDEPFGALDAQTRSQMHQLLLEIWGRLTPTILFVTHDVDEAIFLADRVGVLLGRPGRLTEEVRVDLPKPRPLDVVGSPTFVELKRHLLATLRRGAPASAIRTTSGAAPAEACGQGQRSVGSGRFDEP